MRRTACWTYAIRRRGRRPGRAMPACAQKCRTVSTAPFLRREKEYGLNQLETVGIPVPALFVILVGTAARNWGDEEGDEKFPSKRQVSSLCWGRCHDFCRHI